MPREAEPGESRPPILGSSRAGATLPPEPPGPLRHRRRRSLYAAPSAVVDRRLKIGNRGGPEPEWGHRSSRRVLRVSDGGRRYPTRTAAASTVGPEPVLVANSRLGHVLRPHDLVREPVDLLLFVPALVWIKIEAQRRGQHLGGQFLGVVARRLLVFAETVMLGQVGRTAWHRAESRRRPSPPPADVALAWRPRT